MGRPKRVSPQGIIFCPRCSTNKHISEFYQKRNSVYFIQDDIVYGKPISWCKECMKTYQKSRHKDVPKEELNAEAEALRLKKAAEMDAVRAELAAQGFELGIQKPDGTWTVIPLQAR